MEAIEAAVINASSYDIELRVGDFIRCIEGAHLAPAGHLWLASRFAHEFEETFPRKEEVVTHLGRFCGGQRWSS